MKAAVFLVLWGLSLPAQDIDFHHRTASFTNLEGRAYSKVTLVKGDLDGVIWRNERGSGGRICYTNLSAELLDELGVPPERSAIAADRAAAKAVADARYRAGLAVQAEAQRLAKQEAQAELATNATLAAQGGNVETPYYDYAPPAYPNFYNDYWPFYPYGIGLGPRAPSAASAASASSAMSAPSAQSPPSAPAAPPGQGSASAPSIGSMLPAMSAPSAPMSGAAPGRAPISRMGR